MKKFFAVLMALVLVLSMGTVALAAGTGSITINNAVDGATYSIYKMFDFAAIEGNADKGRYTVVAEWEEFLAGEGSAYLKADETTATIVWNGEETEVRKAELAKKAIAYAKAKGITAYESLPADASGVVTFANVPLGYYAIDTSLGAICALTNVNNKFEAHEKNSAPTIDKLVQEDSDKEWGAENSASIGDTVNYKSTITVGKGAQKYIVHDKMEKGLTFTNGSVNITLVKKVDGTETQTPVPAASYEVKTTDFEDDCDFEIDFTDAFEATLEEGDKLVITYSAVLNENAEIFTDTNDNTIYLQYGETFRTDEITTKTTTFKFDLVKTNEENTIINGAEFELYSNSEAGNDVKVTLVKVTDNTYRVAKAGETGTTTIIEAGIVTIYGLDSDAATTYYLKETKAPDGYNAVKDNIEVILGTGEGEDFVADNLVAETSTDHKTYVKGGVEVENKTGSLLPETGGIGTTIFYVVGLALMLGAAILLITKKRMTAKAE